MSAPLITRRTLDALFRAREPGPLTRPLLEKLGYPEGGATEFPLCAWRQIQLAVAKDWFGHLPESAAMRELGLLYAEGLSETLVGRVFAAAARVLGPERALTRLPTFIQASRSGGRIRVDLLSLTRSHCRLRFVDDLPSPDFIAGSVLGVLKLAGAEGTATVHAVDAESFELELTWR